MRLHDGVCSVLIVLVMRLAMALDDWRRAVNRVVPQLVTALRGSLRKVWRLYVRGRGGQAHTGERPMRRRAANRIPAEVEEKIVQVHVAWPTLRAGKLRDVLYRAYALDLPRETVRRVIRRNQKLIAELEREHRRAGRFEIELPRKLWGIDITVVWVLGFVPLWVAAFVDYRGSYAIAMQPLPWPSSANVARVFERACREHGAPERVLSDRGPEFRAPAFTTTLARLGVEHTLTRPHHPWTNGRVERLFRTFKETVRACFWVVDSRSRWADICQEFQAFYNEHRPHQSFGGLTPAEVFTGRAPARHATEANFFEGRLRWWRFT